MQGVTPNDFDCVIWGPLFSTKALGEWTVELVDEKWVPVKRFRLYCGQLFP
jgi:hypothetical protein